MRFGTTQSFTRRQIITLGLLVLSLGLNLAMIVVLLDARSAARPILSRADALVELADGGPYVREATVKVVLGMAADQLAQLAESRIQFTFPISQTLHISTGVAVNERIPVPVSLVISDTIPVKVEIPFEEQVSVPIRLEIDRTFFVSTTVLFQDQVLVPIDDVIHIDETFETRVLGQGIRIPVRGDIPVQLDVNVPIDQELPIQADVPVQFPISETLPVEISWLIPVDLNLPINLPVETQVVVPFDRTIPVILQVPIGLEVPIDIGLSETPLGDYLRNLAEQLRRISEN